MVNYIDNLKNLEVVLKQHSSGKVKTASNLEVVLKASVTEADQQKEWPEKWMDLISMLQTILGLNILLSPTDDNDRLRETLQEYTLVVRSRPAM